MGQNREVAYGADGTPAWFASPDRDLPCDAAAVDVASASVIAGDVEAAQSEAALIARQRVQGKIAGKNLAVVASDYFLSDEQNRPARHRPSRVYVRAYACDRNEVLPAGL